MTKEITEPQKRLLAAVAIHGLRRRSDGRCGSRYWVPNSEVRANRVVVERLVSAGLLRVASLGIIDEMVATPAALTILQGQNR